MAIYFLYLTTVNLFTF